MSTKTVEKSVLIWHSAEQMFNLVSDVPRYSEFLPWCSKASIVQQHEDGVTARIEMALKGFKQSFTTRNIHHRPERIEMRLVDGPFAHLNGVWQFQALHTSHTDDTAQNACRVSFKLEYAFNSVTLSMLVGSVFDKIANSLMDAFIQRAEFVYG